MLITKLHIYYISTNWILDNIWAHSISSR